MSAIVGGIKTINAINMFSRALLLNNLCLSAPEYLDSKLPVDDNDPVDGTLLGLRLETPSISRLDGFTSAFICIVI